MRQALLDGGADWNQRDSSGRTAFELAEAGGVGCKGLAALLRRTEALRQLQHSGGHVIEEKDEDEEEEDDDDDGSSDNDGSGSGSESGTESAGSAEAGDRSSSSRTYPCSTVR